MEAAPCTARLAPDPSGPPIYYRSFAEGRPLRIVPGGLPLVEYVLNALVLVLLSLRVAR